MSKMSELDQWVEDVLSAYWHPNEVPEEFRREFRSRCGLDVEEEPMVIHMEEFDDPEAVQEGIDNAIEVEECPIEEVDMNTPTRED